jgi:hypothetical protein
VRGSARSGGEPIAIWAISFDVKNPAQLGMPLARLPVIEMEMNC